MKKLIYTLFFVLISVVAKRSGKVRILFHRGWDGSEPSKWYGDVSGGNSKWYPYWC